MWNNKCVFSLTTCYSLPHDSNWRGKMALIAMAVHASWGSSQFLISPSTAEAHGSGQARRVHLRQGHSVTRVAHTDCTPGEPQLGLHGSTDEHHAKAVNVPHTAKPPTNVFVPHLQTGQVLAYILWTSDHFVGSNARLGCTQDGSVSQTLRLEGAF